MLFQTPFGICLLIEPHPLPHIVQVNHKLRLVTVEITVKVGEEYLLLRFSEGIPQFPYQSRLVIARELGDWVGFDEIYDILALNDFAIKSENDVCLITYLL